MARRLLAEVFGTFALVFAGTGAITINEVSGGVVSHVGVALTFGLVVLATIYAIGNVSGAHINPAVTLASGLPGAWKEAGSALYPEPVPGGTAGQRNPPPALQRPSHPRRYPAGGTCPPVFRSGDHPRLFLMFVILSVSSGSRKRDSWPVLP